MRGPINSYTITKGVTDINRALGNSSDSVTDYLDLLDVDPLAVAERLLKYAESLPEEGGGE